MTVVFSVVFGVTFSSVVFFFGRRLFFSLWRRFLFAPGTQGNNAILPFDSSMNEQSKL